MQSVANNACCVSKHPRSRPPKTLPSSSGSTMFSPKATVPCTLPRCLSQQPNCAPLSESSHCSNSELILTLLFCHIFVNCQDHMSFFVNNTPSTVACAAQCTSIEPQVVYRNAANLQLALNRCAGSCLFVHFKHVLSGCTILSSAPISEFEGKTWRAKINQASKANTVTCQFFCSQPSFSFQFV